MPQYLSAQVGVKGILFRNGRLLLLRRRDDLLFFPGLWDLPGGGVEVGASLEDTLVREVREETGFKVRVGRLVHGGAAQSQSTSGKKVSFVVLYYTCSSATRGAPRFDPEEHTEFAWVHRGSLSKYPMGRAPMGRTQLAAIRKSFGQGAKADSRRQ